MLKKMLGTAVVLTLGSALPVHATTVSLAPDSSWQPFDVSDVLSNDQGLGWFDINNGDPLKFTIDVGANKSVMLMVTDAGYAGDVFQVFDNGVSLGLTSDVPASANGLNVDLDFHAALASSSFSHGSFLLGAGLHTITGLLAQSSAEASNSTVGFLSAAPVPLPAPALLMISGIAGLLMRRRKPVAA